MASDFPNIEGKAPYGKSLTDPFAPFPGNINTMDPAGWDNFLWTDVNEAMGLELARLQRQTTSRYEAVGLSIAIMCADVLSTAIARSDLALWKRKMTGGRKHYVEVEPNQHWFSALLSGKPNHDMTWRQLIKLIVMHWSISSNAYVVILRDGLGRPVELFPVQPARMVQRRVGSGRRLFYEMSIQTDYERAMLGIEPSQVESNIILPAADVIHIQGKQWTGVLGMPNTDVGNPFFKLTQSIHEFQRNLFGGNGVGPMVFETERDFSGDMANTAFTRLRDQLRTALSRMNEGWPLLLESGLKAKSVSANARDSMTQEAYDSIVTRICGLMRVPPHKIFSLSTVKYDNQSAANDAFAFDSLLDIAKDIEDAFKFKLLSEDEWQSYYPEFDRMALYATDLKSLSTMVFDGVKAGVIRVNEAREALPLNLEPLSGGDVRLQPVNTAQVADDGELINQAASGQPIGDGAPTGNDPANNQQPAQRILRVIGRKDGENGDQS